MKTETYKGRKLKTLKGKEYGYAQHSVNGEDKGRHLGDEASALDYMRRTIDFADEVGVGSGRMGAEWYAPGTFELCENGHAMEIGGQCGHDYCVSQRPVPEPKKITDDVEALPADVTTRATMFDPELTYFADGTRVVMTWSEGQKTGTTFGRYSGASPYAVQAVRWADGSEDGVAPHVLTRDTADEGRLTMDEALAEAYTNLGIVTVPLADGTTTNRSVDEYLTREYPLNFPAANVDEPTGDADTDTVIRAQTLKSSTGATGLLWDDPTDGLATVNAWAHRLQSGVWTVDGTTVAVRTDDRGHIRGSVIVLETVGSKFPER